MGTLVGVRAVRAIRVLGVIRVLGAVRVFGAIRVAGTLRVLKFLLKLAVWVGATVYPRGYVSEPPLGAMSSIPEIFRAVQLYLTINNRGRQGKSIENLRWFGV